MILNIIKKNNEVIFYRKVENDYQPWFTKELEKADCGSKKEDVFDWLDKEVELEKKAE